MTRLNSLAGGRRQLRIRYLLALMLVIIAAGTALVIVTRPAARDNRIERALDALPIIDRSTEDPSYRRAAFGNGWADLDGDGCRTRDEVLLDTVDRSHPYKFQRQGRCHADIVAGTWTDLYTGTPMTWSNLKDVRQAASIPLDHIVSLAGAYRYGAKNWTRQRRIEFANDELNLTPTTAAINRAKTDADPATWTPPAPGRCAYATRYIAVKTRWNLPVDLQERNALHRLLRNCPDLPR